MSDGVSELAPNVAITLEPEPVTEPAATSGTLPMSASAEPISTLADDDKSLPVMVIVESSLAQIVVGETDTTLGLRPQPAATHEHRERDKRNRRVIKLPPMRSSYERDARR